MSGRVAPAATMTSVVQYCWNRMDRIMAGVHGLVTPYAIPSAQLSGAWRYPVGTFVPIPLGLSQEPALVSRLLRDGYEWVQVPKEVPADGSLVAYFTRLHELDPVRFAHFDPVLIAATTARRAAARVERMMHASLDITTATNSLPSDPAIQAAGVAATAARVAEQLPEAVPYEDLVRLHLDYWGNSPLRAAHIADRAPPFAAEKFDGVRAFSFIGPPPALELFADVIFGGHDPLPKALAAQAKHRGVHLDWVLARRPREGTPIWTAGTPRTDARPTRVVVALPPPRIELDGFGTQELLPFHIKQWDTTRSRLAFRVTLSQPVARTRIEVRTAGTILYAEELVSASWCSPGVHLWTWDGFDADGVFDTRVFKRDRLEVRVTTVDALGRTASGRTHVSAQPGTARWVDARLDRNTRTVDVTTCVRFRRMSEVELSGFDIPVHKELRDLLEAATRGARGLETSVAPLAPVDLEPDPVGLDALLDEAPLVDMVQPPSLAKILSERAWVFSLHMPGLLDLDPARFAHVQSCVLHGIAFHWSREVTLDGAPWALAVSASERTSDALPFFIGREVSEVAQDFGWTKKNQKDTFLPEAFLDRSFNLAAFKEGLPIINLIKPTDDDVGLRYVGAHELGHSVLREGYDPFTSATHKGTSSIVGLHATLRDETRDEVDLMYYGPKNGKGKARAVACEDDARTLVWMARVIVG